MVFAYLFLIILFFVDTKISVKKNNNYLSIEENAPIKGMLVIFVYFSHFVQYISSVQESSILTKYFVMIVGLLGQLIVSMFFVYSGYGLYYKIKQNKDQYISSFLVNRLVPVYLDFVICIFLFLILNILINNNYSVKNILLSFIGWESIGNSNWFMFDTFVSYLLFYFSFYFIKTSKKALYIYTILMFLFVIVLYIFKESYWWNTILCLPMGMWLCYKKEYLDKICENKKYWIIMLILSIIFFSFFYLSQRRYEVLYILTSIFFSMSIVLIQMRVDVSKSKIFSFLGNHVFSIYMLQRLFLIILSRTFISNYVSLYCVLGFLLTVLFSYIFDLILSLIKNKIVVLKRV